MQVFLQGLPRSLQQAVDVTVVATAVGLQEAVAAGFYHIEIHAHLDLTELDIAEGSSRIIGNIFGDRLKSIRVRRSHGILRFSTSGSRLLQS